MDELSGRAVAAAVAVAARHAIRSGNPDVLADGSNVLVHLAPAPVVARVATTTSLVRKPIERWLALDLDIASFLAAQNFPVVSPSGELPPGPHLHDGLAITFWTLEEHDRSRFPAASEVAPLLREMHAALRGYSGNMNRLSPFFEIRGWLDEVELWGVLDSADLAMVRRGYAEIAGRIDVLGLPEQPLHGDAHKKNVLRTHRGLLWTDFEDACSGPIEWDVACLARNSLENRETAIVSYGCEIDPEKLEPFFEARDLQGAVWGAILSTRFPDRRERAAEWMAVCRERYG